MQNITKNLRQNWTKSDNLLELILAEIKSNQMSV